MVYGIQKLLRKKKRCVSKINTAAMIYRQIKDILKKRKRILFDMANK